VNRHLCSVWGFIRRAGSWFWHRVQGLTAVAAVVVAVLSLRATDASLEATRDAVDLSQEQARFERRPVLVNVPLGPKLDRALRLGLTPLTEPLTVRLEGEAAMNIGLDPGYGPTAVMSVPVQNVGRGVARITSVRINAEGRRVRLVLREAWPYVAPGEQRLVVRVDPLLREALPPELISPLAIGFQIVIAYEDLAREKYRTTFDLLAIHTDSPGVPISMRSPPSATPPWSFASGTAQVEGPLGPRPR
jgi:hypothetical protein